MASNDSSIDLHFPIVGVGSSAGGLDALERFFSAVPEKTPMAFVVVSHRKKGHDKLLGEILQKVCSLPVRDATDAMAVKSSQVYIAPPEQDIALFHGKLQLLSRPEGHTGYPIDHFLRSLAVDRRQRAGAVILSGSGSDGLQGARSIVGESGIVAIQDPKTAEYDSMPRSVMNAGLADIVALPEDIPEQLQDFYSVATALPRDSVPRVDRDAVQKLFVLLRSQTAHDFSGYKFNTVQRRLQRRMQMHQITAVGDYVRYVRENPHELDLLCSDLLISVTSFFRDPEAFAALKQMLPSILEDRSTDTPIRAWIPGCSTGEEAYSIAIVLREYLDECESDLPCQIFATDLSEHVIETARTGIYPASIEQDVSAVHLKNYFKPREDGGYRIRKDIRDMVIFAAHNMMADPPFSQMDLISCRNVLIYLDRNLQDQVLPIFHYALRSGGLLLLGPSESVGGYEDLFAAVDKKWKIYRRRDVEGKQHFATKRFQADQPSDLFTSPPRRNKGNDVLVTEVERLLLNRYTPASVLITERGDAVYFHGRTGAYLEPASGRPGANVFEMARPGLKLELPSIVRRAVHLPDDGAPVERILMIRSNGESARVRVSATKVTTPESMRGLVLLSFEPLSKPEPDEAKPDLGDTDTDTKLASLEKELTYTKEHLQTTVEELETTNEELRSSNEELQSSNEELQSTVEELETSREEMQSLNEELQAVNNELAVKNETLAEANDEINNLLDGTKMGIVFLDTDLRIRRFTDTAKQIVHIRDGDFGRPLSDLVSEVHNRNIVADAQSVLDELQSIEVEVQTQQGYWYLMRVAPYRTSTDKIDGVSLTFVDIDRAKTLELETLRLQLAENIVETVRQPILVLDADLHIVFANRSFYRTFHASDNDTFGHLLYDLGDGQWDIPRLRMLLEEILPQDAAVEDFEVEHEFPNLGLRKMRLNARRLSAAPAEALILLVLEDVTGSTGS